MTTIEAEKYIAQGYRIVSRKYNIIARIDRPDWKEHLAKNHMRGMEWVEGLGVSANDHYRRSNNLCKTWIEFGVSSNAHQLIPNSGHDPVGYIEIKEER